MAYESDRGNPGDLAALAATFHAAAREFASASPLYARLAAGVAGDAELLALVAAAPPAQRRATLLLARCATSSLPIRRNRWPVVVTQHIRAPLGRHGGASRPMAQYNPGGPIATPYLGTVVLPYCQGVVHVCPRSCAPAPVRPALR